MASETEDNFSTQFTGSCANPRRRAIRAFDLGLSPSSRLKCPTLSTLGFPVLDISELGARLGIASRIRPPTIGLVTSASLIIGKAFFFKVQVRVVHIWKRAIGVEFVDPTERLKITIREYFRSELAGAALTRIGETPIRYEDGASNFLELELGGSDRLISAFSLNSGGLTAKGSADSGMQGMGATEKTEVLKLIRNIGGLDPGIRGALETLVQSSP